MVSGFLILPLLSALAVLLQKTTKQVKILSLLLSSMQLMLSIYLLCCYDQNINGDQFAFKFTLFEPLGFHYAVAADGLSLVLSFVTVFVLLLVVIGTWSRKITNLKIFHVNLFLLTFSILGTFFSRDLLLFYMFLEGSLVPIIFLVGFSKIDANRDSFKKLVSLTLIGSFFISLGVVSLGVLYSSAFESVSFHFSDLEKVKIPFVSGTLYSTQTLVFLCFLIGLSIKSALFPFHSWLTNANSDLSNEISAALSGLTLTPALYGMMRFFPAYFMESLNELSWLVCMLSVAAVVYGGMVSFAQNNIKKLIAYSSVLHVGFIVLGIFSTNETGLCGSVYLIINHSLVLCGLYLMLGALEDRTESRNIDEIGGLYKKTPVLSSVFFALTLCATSVPLTGGFVGKFFVIMASSKLSLYYASILVFGYFIGSCYALKFFSEVFFGEPKGLKSEIKDLSLWESLCFLPLILLIFLMGVFPNYIFSILGSKILGALNV